MAAAQAAFEGGRFDNGDSFRAATFPSLVKGYGMEREGCVTPLDDPRQMGRLEEYAAETLRSVISKGLRNPSKVTKGFYGPFGKAIDTMNRFSPQNLAMGQMTKQLQKQLRAFTGQKNFSLTSPLASSFVPFDLVPFVRTIYPVYTPLRNKIPRVPGQGLFHRGKILASISGSLPGQLGALQDDSTSEFFGGSFASWPNALPPSGAQTSYDIIIPYRFFALTEGTSWLAQFAGQGFDDLYGLASLVLLQEFMLLEEHDLLASSSQSLTAPAAPICTVRVAGSNETALTFGSANVYVLVTALNYWGETAYGGGNVTAVTTAVSGTSVIDVTIPTGASPGAIGYAIYVASAGSAPARTALFRFQVNTVGGMVGGVHFTLQGGAIPVAGANPPAADTGTGAATRQESLISVLSGLAASGSGPYPSAATAGYANLAVGDVLSVDVVAAALQQMFNGSTGYFANPSEIICSANEAAGLAKSIRDQNVASYQLRIQQSEVAGVMAGVAVSNIVNPVTRSAPEILVHPYLPTGTALLMSYTLPQTQNNLGNVVENVMVQDYAQIGWPVIDPTFRQSILRYGTFFMPAPQYCGILAGLQRQSTTPYQ